MRFAAIYLLVSILLVSCGETCLGIKSKHGSSQDIRESHNKRVFKFEMICNEKEIQLNDTTKLIFESAWVEQKWKYDCDDRWFPVIIKDASSQLVVKVADYDFRKSLEYFFLRLDSNNWTACFGSYQINLDYNGENPLVVNLIHSPRHFPKNEQIIRQLKFYKKLTD